VRWDLFGRPGTPTPGLPAGIFQVVPGDVEVGQALVTHPDVAMIHFTGSTAAPHGP
jgi:acyl-CoA reductase-like NAD-dependent aldehyde dehydrogenase